MSSASGGSGGPAVGAGGRWTPSALIRFPRGTRMSSWATPTSSAAASAAARMGEVYLAAARPPARAVRGEAAAPGADREPGRVRALLPRSRDHVPASPPQHRPDLRLQRRARRRVPTSSWSTWRGAIWRRACNAGPLPLPAVDPHRRRGGVGAGARARARRRAPRSQAGERLPGHRRRPDRRAGQGARLRHLEDAVGGRADLARRRSAGHAVVHGARAGARPGRLPSTAAPISSRWARSPTGCSPARSRSRATTRRPCSIRSCTRIRRRCRCSCPPTGMPAPLQAVLDRALAKQPEQRFGGMMELARAFDDAAERTIGAASRGAGTAACAPTAARARRLDDADIDPPPPVRTPTPCCFDRSSRRSPRCQRRPHRRCHRS